ncbi:MAG: hypothetical protein M1360_00185 [Candidatus Marsarchaeota archaeon]|nr:hypothetical protein [Candidatus Marsarchaeota archaeon]MCL5418347.1 hypothetical protein [Candidatus Marsarchaeota archaeon]
MKRRGFKVIELSAQIRLLMKKERKPITPISVLEEGKLLRRRYGKSAVARLAMKHNRIAKNTVFSGLRSKSELDYIRKSTGKEVVLIYVTAPSTIRLERLKKRERAYTYAVMRKRDSEEDKFGLGRLAEGADFIVSNSSSITALRNDVNYVLAMAANAMNSKG